MNRPQRLLLPLVPLALLMLSPFFFTACEDHHDSDEGIAYMEENAFTLDPIGKTVKPATTNAPLAITPASASFATVGDTAVFAASGGTPPYEWGVGNTTIGAIQVKNGNPCTYVCKQLKQNSVWVTDYRGNVAVATISVTTEE